MIRSLLGTVLWSDSEIICLEVAGFGLELYASGPLMAAARPGEMLRCTAYLQVTEAGMTLFGFADETERALFLEIMQVKTMGGKLSIALFRHLDARTIVEAILSGDSSRLAVPGIGPKRAERICFELKSKVEKKYSYLAGADAKLSAAVDSPESVVVGALVGLGFSQSEAVRAVSGSRAADDSRSLSEEELLSAALARLQRN